jgi:hypothetical protein
MAEFDGANAGIRAPANNPAELLRHYVSKESVAI